MTENLQDVAKLLQAAYEELMCGSPLIAPLAIKECLERLEVMGVKP